MLEGARISVIVPAFNEERLIARTLTTIPSYVDDVYVVDDASRDATTTAARSVGDPRVRVLVHAENRGVGAAIATGYRAAKEGGADVLAVMAGDAQMHPDDLLSLVLPVARGEVDYAKGNRMAHPAVRTTMPRARYLVGRLLSWLTGKASGLRRLSDSQCGYTALAARALDHIELDGLWPRFGYPNDLIGKLAIAGMRIRDVVVRPVYADERSGIRPWHVLVILGLIGRIFVMRIARAFPIKPLPPPRLAHGAPIPRPLPSPREKGSPEGDLSAVQ